MKGENYTLATEHRRWYQRPLGRIKLSSLRTYRSIRGKYEPHVGKKQQAKAKS